jgi:predicted  nucleic acid-binding Zn-ribbon protein
MNFNFEFLIVVVTQTVLVVGFFWKQREKIIREITETKETLSAQIGSLRGEVISVRKDASSVEKELEEHKVENWREKERLNNEIIRIYDKIEKIKNGKDRI